MEGNTLGRVILKNTLRGDVIRRPLSSSSGGTEENPARESQKTMGRRHPVRMKITPVLEKRSPDRGPEGKRLDHARANWYGTKKTGRVKSTTNVLVKGNCVFDMRKAAVVPMRMATAVVTVAMTRLFVSDRIKDLENRISLVL